jgi:hypothetical protein
MDDATPPPSDDAHDEDDDAEPSHLPPTEIIELEPQPSAAAPVVQAPPPSDAMPGDAAPTPLVTPAPAPTPATVAPEPAASAPTVVPEPAPAPASAPVVTYAEPAAATAGPPRPSTFTLWLLIYLIAWGGIMGLTLNHRFDRKFDWNTSYFAVAARNLVRDGFMHLRGGVYLTAGEHLDRNQRDFYAGHPPLTCWLLAGWMKAFGQQDWVIRALPLTFTLLNLLLLYALVRRIFGAPAAFAVTVICSLLPMTAYYAQNVNMEPFVLTFMLGASLGYLAWARSGSRWGFILLCICVILGCWTDWPMYVFTGFLAVAHFLRRRDLLAPRGRTPGGPEDEDLRPARPLVSSLVLLILPLAVVLVFLVFIKINGASFGDVKARAVARMTDTRAGYVQNANTVLGGYEGLFKQIKQPKTWILDLFTPPALLLAALGALFWVHWSRALSIAGGEAGRRAAFRILLCLILMQLVYTLAFPHGSSVHEFWQYYLIVPVAVLAGAFCTWLTVAGGEGRRFSAGVFDRAAWAVAILIPILAAGPLIYRLQIKGLGKDVPAGDLRLDDDYVGAIRQNTAPGDIILTDMTEEGTGGHAGLGFAIPWYADRAFLAHKGDEQDTHSLDGINKIVQRFKGHRILYLWADADGSENFLQALEKQGYPHYAFGHASVFVIDPGNGATAATRPTTTSSSTTKPAP